MSKIIERLIRLLLTTILFAFSIMEISKYGMNMECAPIWMPILWLFGAVVSIARRD